MSNFNSIQNKIKPDIRELTISRGLSYPSDEELLMLILGSGTKTTPVDKLSREVLDIIETSSSDTLVHNLLQIQGIGYSKALSVAAAMELGKRKNLKGSTIITCPKDFIPYVKQYTLKKKEFFICATLNGAKEIQDIKIISIGTINKTLIHPREVFAYAVEQRASGVICCHNHPTGNCLPSEADIKSTQVLVKASNILGITFLDHIIIAKDSYYSFLEHDMLN